MPILDKDIIVEIDKKTVISFNKKYKNFMDANGEECSLDLKEVKQNITEYIFAHREHFKDKKVFAFVYDYDLNICVTVMKANPEYEVYTVIGFSDMVSPDETFEDDEEKAMTKEQTKILKENEKIVKEKAARLEEIFSSLDR